MCASQGVVEADNINSPIGETACDVEVFHSFIVCDVSAAVLLRFASRWMEPTSSRPRVGTWPHLRGFWQMTAVLCVPTLRLRCAVDTLHECVCVRVRAFVCICALVWFVCVCFQCMC